MSNHADRAFGDDVCRCNPTDRETALADKLNKAHNALRSAEDELATLRALGTELTALRGLRDIIREESWKAYPDHNRINRAVTLSAPTGIAGLTERS